MTQNSIQGDAHLLRDALLRKAEVARRDLRAFYEFVMREEHTRAPLKVTPHQRVLLAFVQRFPHCVLRMPAGTSKTFSMTAVTLDLLGKNTAERGAIVSSTQGQAMKPLGMARDLIETSPQLRLVYPHLRRSQRKTDSWSISEITVDRPPGIRDPSLIAVGIDGAIAGARLSWIIVDDILDRGNTATAGGLQKVHDWFDSSVLSRIDPAGGRIVVTNTPWSPHDLTYKLEKAGWPTLTMDVEGDIQFANIGDWDTPEIVPRAGPREVYRLAAHNEPTSPEGEVVQATTPLWPGRYDWPDIEKLRADHLPHRFNQLYMCICRSDESARCKIEWIDACKSLGAGLSLVSSYTGSNPTFTGVDLAVGQTTQHDKTAFFTFEQLPDGRRRILDVEMGQWDAPAIVRKVVEKATRYKSVVRVENNASQQYLVDFCRQQTISLPIKAHATGRNKAHPEYGIEGLFVELQNRAWVIPNDARGRCNPEVQKVIDEALYYDPSAHTGDGLMAWWLAREQAREFGLMAGVATLPGAGKAAGLAARLLSR